MGGHLSWLASRIPRWAAVALVFVVITLSAATVRLFVVPTWGMPAHVDAIVMLNGRGDRLDTALDLAWAHRATFVVISRGSQYYGHGSVCAPRIAGVHIICFDPSPATTQGEAEFAGRLAREYHWRSVALVTITPQGSRARLRVERCLSGPVYVVTSPIPLWYWPYEIAYEWGAMVRAVIFQRGCLPARPGDGRSRQVAPAFVTPRWLSGRRRTLAGFSRHLRTVAGW